MIDVDTFRAAARAWHATMVPEFGRDARRGLTDEQDLALGRRYMAAKYDAGFGGIITSKETVTGYIQQNRPLGPACHALPNCG